MQGMIYIYRYIKNTGVLLSINFKNDDELIHLLIAIYFAVFAVKQFILPTSNSYLMKN